MLPTPTHYCVPTNGSSEEIQYQCLFIRNNGQSKTHCILLLSGTSTQLSDIEYFISRLLERGYALASIERFIGGPFNIRRKPGIERKEALKHFIHQLKENYQIERIEIITHSYASFEVIRLLMDAPELYKEYIRNIIFINPAGFKEDIKFIPHCLRFTFIFILKEYVRVLMHFLNKGGGLTSSPVIFTPRNFMRQTLYLLKQYKIR